MQKLDKTDTAGASATASPVCSQVIYQRHAAVLYRQALLALDEDDARSRLARWAFRRFHQLVTGLVQPDRRPGRGLPRAVRSLPDARR